MAEALPIPKPAATGLLVWLEWALLVAALICLTITETYHPYVTFGILLLVASFAIRAARSMRLLPRTGLEIPVILLLASGALATWAAFDRATALLQYTRLLAAVVFFYALVDSEILPARWTAISFVLAAAYLSVFWPSQHDFSADPGKFQVITALGRLWNELLPKLPGPTVHSNVAAGTLALAIPFGAALAGLYWKKKAYLTAALLALITAIILGGLLMTSSRGAWIGLIAAAGLSILGWIQQKWFFTPKRKTVFWIIVLLAGGAFLAVLLSSGRLESLLGSVPDPTGSLQSRPRLWLESLPLAQDYLFTGSGLMTFSLTHTFYALMIYAPYIFHSHNSLLQVWLEQGMVGLIAVVWGGLMIVSWAWRGLSVAAPGPAEEQTSLSVSTERRWLGWAGFLGLVVVAVHGMFDVVYYVERTLPLLGMAVGFAWYVTLTAQQASTAAHRRTISRVLAVVAVGVALAAAGIFHRSLISAGYANLGAIRQAQIEMPGYQMDQYEGLPMDDIRKAVDLSPAIQAYQKSLGWQPTNPTARRRLADIYLSQGNFMEAVQQMESAWQAGHRDDVTRLLYGDALIAHGRPEEAAGLLAGIPWARSRLNAQGWYRYWLDDDLARAVSAWRASLILDPTNRELQDLLSLAEQKLNDRTDSSNP